MGGGGSEAVPSMEGAMMGHYIPIVSRNLTVYNFHKKSTN